MRTAASIEAHAPSTLARALTAEFLDVLPERPGRRVILTTVGLVAIQVVDRFTELAAELHWSVIANVLAGEPADQLAEFRGFELDSYQLAYHRSQIPRTCGRAEVA